MSEIKKVQISGTTVYDQKLVIEIEKITQQELWYLEEAIDDSYTNQMKLCEHLSEQDRYECDVDHKLQNLFDLRNLLRAEIKRTCGAPLVGDPKGHQESKF